MNSPCCPETLGMSRALWIPERLQDEKYDFLEMSSTGTVRTMEERANMVGAETWMQLRVQMSTGAGFNRSLSAFQCLGSGGPWAPILFSTPTYDRNKGGIPPKLMSDRQT